LFSFQLRNTLIPSFQSLAARLAQRPRLESRDPRPAAAIAVILIPDPLSVLLIRRSEREGDPWSGHVALPGGREEPEDSDLIATAIRETAEEVGILLDRSELLGTLDDVTPRSIVKPPFMVRPFVFGLGSEPRLQLSSEVASAHWEPLETLMRAEARGELPLTIAGVTRRFPSYQTTAGTLWGMTERVLSGVLRELKGES
jgi:8-oxo-dGTP pyrophosphatase MutT (NUDIX family)